jgi:acetyl-CoA C-acetyltransferase
MKWRRSRDRNGLDTHAVDDIIMGCVDPVGSRRRSSRAWRAVEGRLFGNKAPGMQISASAPPASMP